MRTARAKLLAYALALVAVFAVAWTIGSVVAQTPAPVAPAGNPHGH